ncbi:MAG: leucine-rich repeat protein [Clostridia bacterium]|nr:leucine-rich repeat protein [Clostridia bacterium]
MKKKVLLSIIVIVLGILAFGVMSASAETSGYYTYSVSNGEATITDFDFFAGGHIIIPDMLGGYPVTAIGDSVFWGHQGITIVIIPDGVTAIGDSAFKMCPNLTSVSIPDSLTVIGDNAFRQCDSLTSITIPDSVTVIGDAAFAYCNSVTNINVDSNNTRYSSFDGNLYNKDKTTLIQYATGKDDTHFEIPSSVTNIGDYAFGGCEGIASITIPDSVVSIGDYAFRYCTGLTSIKIPNMVTSIGDYTFSGCEGITSITISDSVTSIGDSAFERCFSLQDVYYNGSRADWGKITVGSSNSYLTNATIHFDPFFGNVTYTITNGEVTITDCDTAVEGELVIPDTVKGYPVTAIGNSAFYSCNKLTGITIPDSVATIGNQAFRSCSMLSGITIPKSVTTIGDEAFSTCSGLTKFTVDGNNPNYSSLDGNLYNKEKTMLVCYAGGKDDTHFEIPSSVTTIGDYAFYNCDSLTSISIPDSVTTIGNYAFYSCTRLANVIISECATSIGNYTFSSCARLTSVVIPDSVTKIGTYAFNGCSKLSEVTIGNGVGTIGKQAFNGCTSLSSFKVDGDNRKFSSYDGNLYNKNQATLVQYALGKAETHFDIPSNVTTVGDYAFYGCKKLKSITLPASVTKIGTYAFSNCSTIKTINYNGSQVDLSKITVGSNNPYFTSASKIYFYYVTLLDKDGNEISKKMQNIGTLVDTGDIELLPGYRIILYTDKELTNVYDSNIGVNDNLTLYVDTYQILLNQFETEGPVNVDIGEKGVVQKITFATDKEAKYLSCTIKIPAGLTVSEIRSELFEAEVSSEVIGNDTYLYLFLIYNGEGTIPTYETIDAFDLVLDVSKNAVENETLTVDFIDTMSADDNGIVCEFDNAEFKISPVLKITLEILGADEIDSPATYTASIYPESVTDKEVEWSVSDETIATISEDGILTPLMKGTVTIRATLNDGSGIYAEKTVSVKVYAKVDSIASNIGIWDKGFSVSENSYTIYVSTGTSSIKLTAKHSGTLKGDGLTLPSNVARTVTLSNTSDETVLHLTYTCDGYDDNQYTITVVKFEGTKTTVSEDDKSFTVTPVNMETGKTVILALYNGNKLVQMQPAIYQGEALIFTTNVNYTNAKVMVWNDLGSLSSVCGVEVVK